MTTRPPRRKLVDQLRSWTVEQVAGLLERRPDLAQPRPPADIVELAQRAQHQSSVEAAIAASTLAENRMLQVVVCCRPDMALDELAQALPEGVGLADIEEVLATLETAALVWRHGGRLHASGALRQTMATTLGPPLAYLGDDQTVDYLKAALKVVRADLASQGFATGVPPRITGPDGRPPRKADLITELESLYMVPAVVRAVLAGAPQECVRIARDMADGSPLVELEDSLYFSRYGMGSYYREVPAYWLFERALLVPVGDGYLAVQPREVGVALRGGRPVTDLALAAPVLAVGAIESAQVDASGAAMVSQTLDRLVELLDRWEQAPAKTLKAGGLGATVMKQVAAALETDAEGATRLVELVHLAGLIATTTVSRKERRAYVYDSFVGPVSAAGPWMQSPVPERWRQLATAWLRAERWPSASGRKGDDGKLSPVLSVHYGATAPALRRRVLDALVSLAPGTATTPEILVAYVYWQCPQPWLRLVGDEYSTAIAWVYAEAELLGVVASGSLTSFGRALLAESPRRAEDALQAVLPEPATSFTLQADLTATVVGTLERSMAVELRLLADVESTGAATTLRFSDASLRRAFDAGRDRDAILAFLESHATKGVPKALAYLVNDVARRYGHLQVGPATSVVTSDDPAALADACSHRRTRKLALRLLAPTVAVSPQPPAKVIDGLRQAGFLPTAEGDEDPSVSIQGQAASVLANAGAAGPADERAPAKLPEPFRNRSRPSQRSAPAIDAAAATKLAEALLAAPPPKAAPSAASPAGDPARSGPEPTPLELSYPDIGGSGEAPDSLDELLEWAFHNDRAVAIRLGDADHVAEPMLVEITVWEPHRIVGTDLDDGTVVSVLAEHIASATDLGPVEEVGNVAMLGTGSGRTGRRRRR